jgi:hypothetical protein
MRAPLLVPLTVLVVAFLVVPGAHGVDHANLDGGRPLRLEDAYAIPAGELALELGIGFDSRRHADDHVFGELELLWGAVPNLQVGIGTAIISSPHDVDEQSKSGDLHLSGLYNFNQETSLPAFAIKAELNLPTGVDSAGVDGAITGIVTKSFGTVSLHFNAGYEFLSGTMAGERDGLYKFAFGASLPIGAPMHTRTTLICDLFVEQALAQGEDEIIGAEIGVRHQLSERIVIDGGIGTEFDGPAERSQVFAMLGLSITF